LVRAEFLSIRERDFVQPPSAKERGDLRIIFIHILPNAMAPILVAATLGVAAAVLIESSLSFLGIGVQPPDPSWGNMLTEGKDNIEIAWWLSVFPGLAILITVMGYICWGRGSVTRWTAAQTLRERKHRCPVRSSITRPTYGGLMT